MAISRTFSTALASSRFFSASAFRRRFTPPPVTAKLTEIMANTSHCNSSTDRLNCTQRSISATHSINA